MSKIITRIEVKKRILPGETLKRKNREYSKRPYSEDKVKWNHVDGYAVGYSMHPRLYHQPRDRNKFISRGEKQSKRLRKPSQLPKRKNKVHTWGHVESTQGYDWKDTKVVNAVSEEEPVAQDVISAHFMNHVERFVKKDFSNPPSKKYTKCFNWARLKHIQQCSGDLPLLTVRTQHILMYNRSPDIVLPLDEEHGWVTPDALEYLATLGYHDRSNDMSGPFKVTLAVPPLTIRGCPIVIYANPGPLKELLATYSEQLRRVVLEVAIEQYISLVLSESFAGGDMLPVRDFPYKGNFFKYEPVAD
jgi:hypothetical protein